MDRRTFLQRATEQLGVVAVGPNLLRHASGLLTHDTVTVADRFARLARHAPVVKSVDPFSALSVGNGAFAFTVDATGLQTFSEAYREIPLATQAEWGWHTLPNPNGYRAEDAFVKYDAHGRQVEYASRQNSPAATWLRENPHRLSLARIGFMLTKRDGSRAQASDIGDIAQRLDLASGSITSAFTFEGRRLSVRTVAHPERDAVAVAVDGTELNSSWFAIAVAFPYGGRTHTGDPADWTHDGSHRTEIASQSSASVEWHRTLDADEYWCRAAWSAQCALAQESAHHFRLAPTESVSHIECVVSFSRGQGAPITAAFTETASAAERHWKNFWLDGGTLDLAGSKDTRSHELERRIVLSEYLTAIQCAGTMPPQETGETFNSWYGKAHLEMHWWHAAHFALWNRAPMLARSLPWYQRILPVAQQNAARQGYTGARWPKMIGPEGRDSPSGVGVFLIWQQPHPIYLSELVYRARPSARILNEYKDVVFASAEFMASYPFWDDAGRRYVLGPPLIPAQESHPPATTFNPTFELAYWAFGLETAQQWRKRLGLPREKAWDRVLNGLSALPMTDGLYVNAESAPNTFTEAAQRRDHPTLLGAYGFVGSPRVNRAAMRRTLQRTLDTWQWDDTWGWDYPLVAMTAARLGEGDLAIDALLMNTPKNRYLPNGHNYQRPGLTIYLPGNGAVLAATAMMAAGWDGAPAKHAPGFPASNWSVRAENLRGLP